MPEIPKKQVPNTQPLFSFYADYIITKWKEGSILFEFAQEPFTDNGYLPSCRIYINPDFLEPIINSLKNVLNEYEKKYGKLKE